MVNTKFFGEGFCDPAFHPGRDHRDEIDRTAFDGDVSANRFETFAPKQLAGSGDMLLARKAIVVLDLALSVAVCRLLPTVGSS